MRNIAYLPPTPAVREEWQPWRLAILKHRLAVNHDTDIRHPAHKLNRAREISRCEEDRLYLAAVYGTIYEARPDEDEVREAGYIPFIPYPFQVHLWDWLDQRMRCKGAEGDGLIPKSRTMGLSNTVGFWGATKWMIETPFQMRIASRVADLVDKTGDPDSLFWKVDTFLQGLPEWLLKAFTGTFSWRRHRADMILRNPRNGNVIKGESTTANLGRGGRASVIFYDEAAFMDGFDRIWTAGRASTKHRIACSTVNIENGMTFHDIHKRKNGYLNTPVLEIPWNAHPEHDDAWMLAEIERDTPEGIKREVLMDYFAGTGEWVYPESHDKEAGDYPYEPYAGPVYGCFDDGFDDEWCMHLIQHNLRTGRLRVLESYRNSHQKVDFYGALMTGVPRSDFQWGKDELAFVEVVKAAPGITWIGDPHIGNREQITGMSVFDRLAEQYNIHVMYDMRTREHVDRRVALSHLLPMMDFRDTVRVAYTLSALQRNRFKKARPHSENQTEARKPIHDDTSHPVQALEWFAVSFEQFVHTSGKTTNWIGEDNL